MAGELTFQCAYDRTEAITMVTTMPVVAFS
jgi:hypothetical protein